MDAIAVGDFRGPAKLAVELGPAIGKALTDDLKKLGVAVKRRAELEVNGEYRDVEDPKTKLMAVEIKAHVVDRTGAEVVAFEPRGILNVTTIAALIGVTVTLPGRRDRRGAQQEAHGRGRQPEGPPGKPARGSRPTPTAPMRSRSWSSRARTIAPARRRRTTTVSRS